MSLGQLINGKWAAGNGEHLISKNPATLQNIWEGNGATTKQVDEAVAAARNAFKTWFLTPYEKRVKYLENFVEIVKKNRDTIKHAIAEEIGKPYWEADTEVGALINKLTISIKAYLERTPDTIQQNNGLQTCTRHKPHGVIAVYGPFNFPAHIPNGHIMPALLAGNTIVFKPSENSPKVAELIIGYWQESGLPDGIINLVQGSQEVGIALANHADIDGIFFTGSSNVGNALTKTLIKHPHRIIALELGGNNPLVVHEVNNIRAAVYNTIQSAFVTAGQRCTCARRLIVPKSEQGNKFVNELGKAISEIQVGRPTDSPEPFMGPVISNAAASNIETAVNNLVAAGGKQIVDVVRKESDLSFLTPGLIDVTNIPTAKRKDQEIFGPALQLIWVDSFEAAIAEANNTRYGLSAGILTDNKQNYENFYNFIRAGIVNWNKPLTGASSSAPFGGVGISGNHRPSAYYAADYCAYPVASMEIEELLMPEVVSPGLKF